MSIVSREFQPACGHCGSMLHEYYQCDGYDKRQRDLRELRITHSSIEADASMATVELHVSGDARLIRSIRIGQREFRVKES